MRRERRDLRTLLSQLTPAEWDIPTLCGEWTVRDLVVHLIAWDDLLLYRTPGQHVAALLRFGWLYALSAVSMRRLNRRLQRRVAERDPIALVNRFGAQDDPGLKWLFDRSNSCAHLAEYVIHHQDIRLPLNKPRTVPSDRLVGALNGVTKLPGVRLGALRQLRMATVEAADLDWKRGRGPRNQHNGEDLLMRLAGRNSQ